MRPGWRVDSLICTAGFIVERTGHSPREESTFRSPTGGNVRWASRHWRTRLFKQAVVTILNQIYEVDFQGFSYGFRPGRSPHQALDALTVGIQTKRVNWVLDCDIQGFFDNLSHEWLVKFIKHRVADPRMLRLTQKWLRAGVSEDGQWSETTVGTPQGSVVSPLLANVYLHYVFDLWVEAWRKKVAKGDVIVVRYADDFVVGFQYRAEA